jgi:hypothetical protein
MLVLSANRLVNLRREPDFICLSVAAQM